MSSTSVSTPQGLLLSYLGNAVNDYQFTTSSGTQTVANGDMVYVGSDTPGFTPTYTTSSGTQTMVSGNTVLASNGEVYRYDGPTSESVNLGTTNFATAPFFDPNIYIYNGVTPTVVASVAGSTFVTLNTGDTVLAANGNVYKYIGSTSQAFNFANTAFLSTSAFQLDNGATPTVTASGAANPMLR